jgi:hypothetical protein
MPRRSWNRSGIKDGQGRGYLDFKKLRFQTRTHGINEKVRMCFAMYEFEN